MTDDRALSGQIAATLEAYAARVTVSERPFDPRERPRADPKPARHRSSRLLVAAAAMAVLVAATALALQGASDSPGAPGEDVSAGEPPSTPSPSAAVAPPTPDGAPAPATTIEGLDLWGVWWYVPGPEPSRWAQLFGDLDDPDSMLLVEAGTAGPGGSTEGRPVTVRGRSGTVAPAKDRPDLASTLYWEEEGLTFAASFRGMDQGAAIAIVDALQWRSDDTATGFEPPADGPLGLLQEVLDPVQAPLAVNLAYSDRPPTPEPRGRMLSVRTMAGTGAPTVDYLRTWFNGTRDAEGVASAYDPTFGTLVVASLDGQLVVADPAATDVPRRAVEQLVASVRPTTAEELAEMWVGASRLVASLPLLTQLDLPSGTVQVRGEAGVPRALCLQLDAGTVCPALGADPVGTAAGANELAASFQVGETWIVAAADTATAPVVDGAGEAEVESRSDGTWNVILQRPDPGVDQVELRFGSNGITVNRPWPD